MNKRTDLIWLGACTLVSILIIGFMTDFGFKQLDIQLYDTYYVFNPFSAIVYTSLILYTTKNIYLVFDLMTSRYKVLALLASIINPLIALFFIIAIGFAMQSFLDFRKTYPDVDCAGRLFPILIMAGIICFQIVIEVKALKKIKGVLH